MEPELTRKALLLRLAVIGLVLAGIITAFAYAGGWLTPQALTPAAIVDRFQQLNGPHPGFRRNHAKGVCVTGTFESNGQGAEYSKAEILRPGKTPILGRFAFAGGMPYVPDAPKIVRSLAVLLKPPGGEEWRLAMINLPIFPVKTPQDFYQFMLISAPDPATGKPDPAKMKAFLDAHPETAKALQQIGGNAISSGFANTTYNGLNAFLFTNLDGTVTPIRCSLVPIQEFQPADLTAPASPDSNYLFDALIADVHKQPLQWRLVLTIGQPGDPTNDATAPWPADRKQVDAGTLTINTIESEDTSPIRDINFDPMILPNGIAGSDDPLLSARSAAYSQSFTRREGEPKSPSAVSPEETER